MVQQGFVWLAVSDQLDEGGKVHQTDGLVGGRRRVTLEHFGREIGYPRERGCRMVHHVKDMSAVQRIAIEHLLGRALLDGESLTIRPATVLKDAPVGDARAEAFRRYQADLDMLADRVREVPAGELESAVDEALFAVRHSRE